MSLRAGPERHSPLRAQGSPGARGPWNPMGPGPMGPGPGVLPKRPSLEKCKSRTNEKRRVLGSKPSPSLVFPFTPQKPGRFFRARYLVGGLKKKNMKKSHTARGRQPPPLQKKISFFYSLNLVSIVEKRFFFEGGSAG